MGNAVKVAYILVLGVLVPWLVRRGQPLRCYPGDIAVFNYGFAACLVLDWFWAKESGVDLYAHYSADVQDVPCGVAILTLAILQLVVLVVLNITPMKRGLRSPVPWKKSFFHMLAFGLASFSLLLLITPEIRWR